MPRGWLTAWLLIWVPISLAAADFPAGTIQATGPVYLDGAELKNSSSVTSGDVIESQASGLANMNLVGSTVQIEPSTSLKFERAGLALDRGTLEVASGKQLTVLTRCLRVTPTSTDWTQFNVTRSNGRVHVVARKGDVVIRGESAHRDVLKESKETWRDDGPGCGGAVVRGAVPAAKGPMIDAAMAERAALAASGALLTWIFLQSDDPVSPAIP